jgi:hypothetical protein
MKLHSTLVCLAVLLGLFSLAGGSQAGEGATPPAAGMGILTGRVTKWPVSPVQGPGTPPAAAPAPGVKILIYGAKRQEIAAVLTDEDGQYRLNLPAGPYLIEMAPVKGKGFSKDLPAKVVITQGQETILNISLDTGIR